MDTIPRSDPLNLVILIPVYNDWDSVKMLLRKLDDVSVQCGIEPIIVVIDDGSTRLAPQGIFDDLDRKAFRGIELVHLHMNIGHQRAIAVGLSEIQKRHKCDLTIVMDADGEDKPEDIQLFIQAYYENPNRIVVAQRSKRSEGIWFRLFYKLYKFLFRIFVGRDLDFGNFCMIPKVLLGKVIYNPLSWNHLAASISRTGHDVVKLKTVRGTRFHGRSSMRFERLVTHGFSAISVFLDVVMIRILIVSSLIMVLSIIGVGVVIWVRLFTELAIPGWATTAVGLLSIIGLQSLVLSTMASFVVLRSRSEHTMIPAIDAPKYVERIEEFLEDG
jgi:glycosyltransferase involved in cell wall biosynthesis